MSSFVILGPTTSKNSQNLQFQLENYYSTWVSFVKQVYTYEIMFVSWSCPQDIQIANWVGPKI